MRITDEHIGHLLEHGYVVVEDFLTPEEVARGRQELSHYFPTLEELEARPYLFEAFRAERGAHDFPYVGDMLNQVTVHPDIVGLAERLLGTDDLALTQSQVWGKYAGTMSTRLDQPLHGDYANNTLVVPRDEGDFRQLPVIVYWSDVDETMGPTYVVSKTHTQHVPSTPVIRTRDDDPALYEHEVPILAKAGSALVYTMGTFHRGSRMLARRGVRYTQHVVYRAAAYQWMGWTAWPVKGLLPEMQRFIEGATPRQRTFLGFPAPGHEYWDEATLAGVAARYPGMDMTPYVEAAAQSA